MQSKKKIIKRILIKRLPFQIQDSNENWLNKFSFPLLHSHESSLERNLKQMVMRKMRDLRPYSVKQRTERENILCAEDIATDSLAGGFSRDKIYFYLKNCATGSSKIAIFGLSNLNAMRMFKHLTRHPDSIFVEQC